MNPFIASVLLVLAAAGLAAAPSIAGAQTPMPSATSKPLPPTAATQAYRDAFTQLQLDMNIRYSGDADRDFAALLAAQSKAMAAMAAIELKHGTNPATRELATKVQEAAERDRAAATALQGPR